MADFSEYVLMQVQKHPGMEAQDAAKMCYQASFGAEHAAIDAENARRMLYSELESTEADDKEMILEPLSDSVGRLNLSAWKARGLPGEWLLNIFLDVVPGDGDYSARLDDIAQFAGRGLLPFSARTWQSFMEDYMSHGVAALHHSDRYRALERPAYRLVSRRTEAILGLLEKMSRMSGGILAIDGRSGAGKSSLAEQISRITGAGIIHMDDFFLPEDKRSAERLAQPGGNVDHERFSREVLPHLREPEEFYYSRFDCKLMKESGQRQVKQSPWRIVEGSYCQHPAFGEYMDIRVFCTVSADEQRKRILARNGAGAAKRFEEAWIPMEEKYFSAFSIAEKADFVFNF